jgi:hypothetical protein
MEVAFISQHPGGNVYYEPVNVQLLMRVFIIYIYIYYIYNFPVKSDLIILFGCSVLWHCGFYFYPHYFLSIYIRV